MRCLAFLAGLAAAATDEEMERVIVETFAGRGALLGSATAAHQVEGGRFTTSGPDNTGEITGRLRANHIWDDFSRNVTLRGGDTADVAVDFYHHWEKDVDLIHSLQFNAFRFSISWTRLVRIDPSTKAQTINPDGLAFYQNLVDGLTAKGVEPVVTLYHWDLPSALVDYRNLTAHGGLNDPDFVGHFVAYAELVFANLKGVRYFTTFNEPQSICVGGYGGTGAAPGLGSTLQMYRCGHNLLLAHARAVASFRRSGPAGAKISLNLNQDYAYPRNASNPDDQAAAQRQLIFRLGWWADPVYRTGDYPEEMRTFFTEHGIELRFTPEEQQLLKGSSDYYAMQHYSSMVCTPAAKTTLDNFGVSCTSEGTESLGWWPAASFWLKVHPEGIRAMLAWIQDRYHPSELIITENGVDDEDTGSAAGPTQSCGALDDPTRPGNCGACTLANVRDQFRIEYYRGYLYNVALAVKDGVNVRGYFAWSLLDNFEWSDGFRCRFGLVCIDYTSPTKDRIPKSSATWWQQLLDRINTASTTVVDALI